MDFTSQFTIMTSIMLLYPDEPTWLTRLLMRLILDSKTGKLTVWEQSIWLWPIRRLAYSKNWESRCETSTLTIVESF